MGSWAEDVKPKFPLGAYRTAEGGLGLQTARELAGPFPELLFAASFLCMFLPPHGAPVLQRGLEERGGTASDTRVGGPQPLSKMDSFSPLHPNPATATLSTPTPIPENTWKEVSALRPLAGRGGLTVTSSLGT